MANNILDPLVIVTGTVLKIPSYESLFKTGGPLISRRWFILIYNTNKYTNRMPYISVTIAGKNMSVIPPKYINSFSVDRYTQDENGAASFSLNLVAPVSAFDNKTADSLTFLLNYLLSSSVLNISEDETEANLSLDLVYGWQNGETFAITDAIVTACDVVISDAGNIATYTVSGVVDKVMFNGNLKEQQVVYGINDPFGVAAHYLIKKITG